MSSIKNLRKNMLLILFLITAVAGYSESPTHDDSGKKDNDNGVLISVSKYSQRKRMPSKQLYLEVIYEEGILTLDSGSIEGSFSLEFLSEESNVAAIVPFIKTGESVSLCLDANRYTVKALAANGMEFVGELVVY